MVSFPYRNQYCPAGVSCVNFHTPKVVTINLNLQKYKCVNYEKLAPHGTPVCVGGEAASSHITHFYTCQQRAPEYMLAINYGTEIISFIVTGLVNIWIFINEL